MKSTARIFVLLFVALHLLVATAVWWLMPGGFAIDHPRFWANRAAPIAVSMYAAAILVFSIRRYWRAAATLLVLSPIAWIGAAIGGLLTFPVSGRYPAVVAAVAALTVLVAIRRHFVSVWPGRGLIAVLGVIAMVIGGLLPLTQRARPAQTTPLSPAYAGPTTRPLGTVLLTQQIGSVRVVPSTGLVMAESQGRSIHIQPMLTFISRSPDGCWTNLAPRQQRLGLPRQLTSFERFDDSLVFSYTGDGDSGLTVSSTPRYFAIQTFTSLPKPVFSHLNTHSEITVMGHRKLSLTFGPIDPTTIDVLPSDYPVGRPARFAYIDAKKTLHVVEATSGEKGPFRELASGPLPANGMLDMVLLDDGQPFAFIKFIDFAAQASTQLSPTAGWGVPENSIEFSLSGDSDRSPASLFFSLASTSVGRGWDSVGHAAGMYGNRIYAEVLPPATTQPAGSSAPPAGSPGR